MEFTQVRSYQNLGTPSMTRGSCLGNGTIPLELLIRLPTMQPSCKPMRGATDAYNLLNEAKEAPLTPHPCPHQRLALPSVPSLGPGPQAALADSAGEIAICSSSQTALLGPTDCQED